MRGSLLARLIPSIVIAMAIVTITLGATVIGASAVTGTMPGDDTGTVVVHAGWADGWSPLWLLVGVIVFILVVKLIVRLVAGPRWYGPPWAWGHGHPGWHGGRHDASEAFRRWHDEAHAEQTSTDQPPQAPSGAAPPQAWPYSGQPPQWPPYPPPPTQPPAYPGQPPSWPPTGQPPTTPGR